MAAETLMAAQVDERVAAGDPDSSAGIDPLLTAAELRPARPRPLRALLSWCARARDVLHKA